MAERKSPITKEQYIAWVVSIVKADMPKSPQEVEDVASKKFEELTRGFKADVIQSDEGDIDGHIQTCAKVINDNQLKYVRTFLPWHEFPGGSGDDYVSVMTSEEIDHTFAEILADLEFSFGALD